MITTSVILSALSLAVSTATLVVVLVGARRAQATITETVQTVDGKIKAFKDAVGNL